MQSRAVREFTRLGAVRRGAISQPMAPAIAQSQRWNSFIKNVMDQVKKDMENDPKMREDWKKWEKNKKHMDSRRDSTAERMENVTERLKSASATTSEYLSQWKERASEVKEAANQKASEATAQNESLRKAQEFMKKRSESVSSVSSAVFDKTKTVFGGVMDKTNKTLNFVGGEHEKAEKLAKWKAAQAQRDSATASQQQKAEAADFAAKAAEAAAEAAAAEADPKAAAERLAEAKFKADAAAKAAEEMDPGSAVVVSKTQDGSSWDRFGAGLRDMPFLSNVFENPLFERMFGESEIAASIREMKDIDPHFFIQDFAEEIEEVVAPHIVQSFLEGNQDSLELHCGEAAFAAVNASIKARMTNKMSLDTAILAGPKEVELKGAQRMDKGPPCFIWTFNTQQVNCLRDREGDIIEGAIDDIRTVYYAMAVTRHPELEKTLEYPWQVTEMAIVGNQPCW